MEVNYEIMERTLIIKINGEIDHHCADEIRERIDKEFERSNCKYIIFDFDKVDFMDSSGIGMLIGRYKIAQRKGGNVIACNIRREIKRIFEISGLFKIITSFDSLDDAIDNLCIGG